MTFYGFTLWGLYIERWLTGSYRFKNICTLGTINVSKKGIYAWGKKRDETHTAKTFVSFRRLPPVRFIMLPLHVRFIYSPSVELWRLHPYCGFFGDQKNGMENGLNVSNSDTASPPAEAQGIVGVQIGKGEKRCHCWNPSISISESADHSATPQYLAVLRLPLSSRFWYADRESNSLSKCYCKPPLNTERCGNICPIPQLCGFLLLSCLKFVEWWKYNPFIPVVAGGQRKCRTTVHSLQHHLSK